MQHDAGTHAPRTCERSAQHGKAWGHSACARRLHSRGVCAEAGGLQSGEVPALRGCADAPAGHWHAPADLLPGSQQPGQPGLGGGCHWPRVCSGEQPLPNMQSSCGVGRIASFCMLPMTELPEQQQQLHCAWVAFRVCMHVRPGMACRCSAYTSQL